MSSVNGDHLAPVHTYAFLPNTNWAWTVLHVVSLNWELLDWKRIKSTFTTLLHVYKSNHTT